MMDLEGLSQLCFDHACELLRDDDGVHCETLLALFAGLTGTQLFANEADHTDGAWDLPPGANMELEGVDQAVNELCKLINQVVEGHLEKPAKFASSVPPNHVPAEDSPELVADYFESFSTLLDRQDVEADERPFLYAVITAQAIITVEKSLPIPVGLKIVDDGIRRCARTRPLEYRRHMLS